MTREFIETIAKVQSEVKAPKNLMNSFGGYSYRSAEGILEAVKPILNKYGLTLTLTDDIVAVGSRIYVKAVATLTDGENELSTTAYAREAENRKGLDDSQITGSASSYARKYSLNGLFLLDDNKDADSMDNREIGKEEYPKPGPADLAEDMKAYCRGYYKIARDRGDTAKADEIMAYVDWAKKKIESGQWNGGNNWERSLSGWLEKKGFSLND